MSLILKKDPISTSRKRHGLYLGSKGDAKSRSKLDAWGVTHILNVTPEKEAGIKVNTKSLSGAPFAIMCFLVIHVSDEIFLNISASIHVYCLIRHMIEKFVVFINFLLALYYNNMTQQWTTI